MGPSEYITWRITKFFDWTKVQTSSSDLIMDSCSLSESPVSSKAYTGLCGCDRSLVDLVDRNKSGSGWQLPKGPLGLYRLGRRASRRRRLTTWARNPSSVFCATSISAPQIQTALIKAQAAAQLLFSTLFYSRNFWVVCWAARDDAAVTPIHRAIGSSWTLSCSWGGRTWREYPNPNGFYLMEILEGETP